MDGVWCPFEAIFVAFMLSYGFESALVAVRMAISVDIALRRAKEKPVLSDRNLEHSAIAEILLFEGCDNDLIPSDSSMKVTGSMCKKQNN
jgi:hypothetical protein